MTESRLLNNNYRLLELVSAGGMGEVHRGENAFTGDPVAIKVILENLAGDETVAALFKREARILGQLHDDAIVRYHNFFLDSELNRFCLVMEFVEGPTLSDHLRENGALDVAKARDLMRRLAQGLGRAHAKGVIHRDLSPDNVILRGGRVDRPVLIDFGIARAGDATDGTLHGQLAGKFRYISPEQLGHFNGEITPRTDIYGLGLLMAAVLCGHPLDMGGNVVEAVEARRMVPDLSAVPAPLRGLLAAMLAPDPALRPATMADALRLADAPEPTMFVPVVPDSSSPFDALPQPEPEPEPERRGRWLWALPVLAATAAAGAWFVTRSQPDAPVEPPEPPVQHAGLPAPDTATREGFLAAFAAGPCTYATRPEIGANAGRIEAFSARADAFTALPAAYEAEFGAAPETVAQTVTDGQCAALDLLRGLQGRADAPPALTLDMADMASDETLLGRISDVRGRAVWLFLVSAGGGVFDLTPRLTGAADGSFTFGFTLSLAEGTGPQPQLLVALVADRPLVSAATAPSGATAADLLPRLLDEVAARGGGAAAVARRVLVNPA